MNNCHFNLAERIEGYKGDPPEIINFCKDKWDRCMCSQIGNGEGAFDRSKVCNEESKEWSLTPGGQTCDAVRYFPTVAGFPNERCCTLGQKCAWYGDAPFCDGECPENWYYFKKSKDGDGHKCLSGYKKYCGLGL